MRELKSIEFSLTPSGKIQYSVEGGTRVYNKNDYEFTGVAMAWLNENYPDAVKKLEKEFSDCRFNRPLFHWKIVTRFFACKCGATDNVLDIDEDGILHSEFIQCPYRQFCKNMICEAAPKFRLTPVEKEIMPLLADGYSQKMIANELHKSPDAIKSTIFRACKRFGLEANGKKLVAFCNKQGLL
jgi:hypothetical protein